MQKKSGFFALFYKKSDKNLVGYGKSSTFAPAKRNEDVLICKNIGVWCNGNTTDSGPVILGSSPSTPTEETAKLFVIKHLAIFLFHNWCDFSVLSRYRLIKVSSINSSILSMMKVAPAFSSSSLVPLPHVTPQVLAPALVPIWISTAISPTTSVSLAS